MLDKLTAEQRHIAIVAIVAVLTIASQVIPALEIHPAVAAGLAAVVSYALLYFTPLTKQYGVGSKEVK